eukprot:scaffold7052_cov254-Pinguiococcus_pyrenoidosus.AAC.32
MVLSARAPTLCPVGKCGDLFETFQFSHPSSPRVAKRAVVVVVRKGQVPALMASWDWEGKADSVGAES